MPNPEDRLLYRSIPSPPDMLEEHVQEGGHTFSELFDWYLDTDTKTALKIQDFREKVNETYLPIEASYIDRALIIATVAHQLNWDISNRIRKERDRNTGAPIPYIHHPLEMADRLVDEKFNWVGIAAILLHDVPEDVDLGEGLGTKDEWFEVLRNEFGDTGQSGLLVDLIGGMTEQKLPDPEEDDGIREKLRETQMYKMIAPYLLRGRLKGRDQGSKTLRHGKVSLSPDEDEAICEVVYNLHQLFTQALQSPAHLQLLSLKITDIWHNFRSPAWIKPAKVLRGRLAASIAEWMGWYSMRSDLIYLLAEIANTNSPYAPVLSQWTYRPRPGQKDLSGFELRAYDMLVGIAERFKGIELQGAKIFAGIPVVYVGYPLSAWDESTLPMPEVVVQTMREQQRQLETHLPREVFSCDIPAATDQAESLFMRGKNSHSVITDFIKRMGRRRIDYTVRVSGGKAHFMRFEDGEMPYIVDLFRQNSEVTFSQVPEARALFHNELYNTDLLDTHLISLIGFLYEPNMSVQLGHALFCICVDGCFYFVDGNITFGELGEKLGKDIVTERNITAYNGDVIRNVSNDVRILHVAHKYTGSTTFADRFMNVE